MEADFVFGVGITLSLQITALMLATFALQRWVKDARAASRLWTACFVGVIVLVLAGFLLPHRRLFSFPGEVSREAMLGYVVWYSRVSVILVAIWGIGLVASIVRRMSMCLELLRFLDRRCVEVDAAELFRRVGIGDMLQPRRPWQSSRAEVNVLVSSRVEGPFCWQLHRPVIVLPKFLLDDDDVTLRYVLLHELEHLRTQHPMQHFLQGACGVVFWFHPVVWSASKRAELNREYLCDEVAADGKFSRYLRTLARVAERCGSLSYADAPKGTLAFGSGESTLIRRTRRLVQLSKGKHRCSFFRQAVAMVGLFVATALIQQVWLPTNAMASRRSDWSPWPTWTADALHRFDIKVRDFEPFEDRIQMRELLGEDDDE